MIKSDYLMKMIEQMTIALTRVLKLRESEHHDDALREIDQTMQRLTGLNSLLVNTLPSQTLLTTLRGGSGQLDTAKCLVIADLLVQEAEILETMDRGDESPERYLKALYLMSESFVDNPRLEMEEYPGKIWNLVDRLDEFILPMALSERLLELYGRYGQYSTADDLIDDMLESEDPERARELGRAFYEGLLERSDDELIDGGLPREEVREGLERLSA